ncbi:MAG: rolling circle replication-associated protein [Nitrospiraceae bacterium]
MRAPSGMRDGASHPHPAAAPPAAAKLVKKTYLHHAPSPHSSQPEPTSWSVTTHDFGKHWVESSWGKVDARPGKRGVKGRSLNPERNQQRARTRAGGVIRRKCLTIGADHLVTLTYRENVQDRTRTLEDMERFHRMLKRAGASLQYVTVLEYQKRGAIHLHIAVRGFQDVRLLRRCWYRIVGDGQGQVNVKGPRPGSSPVKLARYISKYISKDIDALPREAGEHRYFCSLGITVPTERYELALPRPSEGEAGELYCLMLKETLRRIGVHCNISQWIGGGGSYGWISGFEDPTHRWITGSQSVSA